LRGTLGAVVKPLPDQLFIRHAADADSVGEDGGPSSRALALGSGNAEMRWESMAGQG
jgi:hypothetical protein